MTDLISRQAAIDALAKFVPYAICDESTESYTNGLTDAYNLICQLPSAEPVRHGKWKNDCMGVLRCSECGAQAPWRYKGEMYDMVDYRWKANYCPVCGARMDEE